MLTQVFQSEPFVYFKRGDFWLNFFGADYHNNVEPYIEKLTGLKGMFVQSIPNLTSPSSIYVFTTMATSWWPSWATAFHRFDAGTGKYVARIDAGGGVFSLFLSGGCMRSRGGQVYFRDIYGGRFAGVRLGLSATLLPTGEQPEEPDSFSLTGQDLLSSTYEDMLGFGHTQVDEFSNVLLNTVGSGPISVYNLTTGAFIREIELMGPIAQLCLEDADHVYVLMSNRRLALVNYQTGAIMNITRVPALSTEDEYWNQGDVAIAWDYLYRRLLLCEMTPDNPDGSCTTIIRGFRMVPTPTRLTTPIPLKAPRKGRIIPVMCQVVGDMNEGVGGYIVRSVVTRDGQLVGTPTTDNYGRAITQVYCTDAGQIEIVCTVDMPDDGSLTTGDPSGAAVVTRPQLQVNGVAFDYRGLSAFGLLSRYLQGEDISDTLNAAVALNCTIVRVIGMLAGGIWETNGAAYYPGDGDTTTDEDDYCNRLQDFVDEVNAAGLTVELTLFACLPDISAYQTTTTRRSLATKVATALVGKPKVLIEVCQEPTFNGLSSTGELKALMDAMEAIDADRLYAAGAASEGAWQSLLFGIPPAGYLPFHGLTSTDWKWVTKYFGGAPITQRTYFPVEDQPQRPDYDTEVGKYFALGFLAHCLQFGVTFHYAEGLTGDPPTAAALTCAQAMRSGLNAIPWTYGGRPFVDYQNTPMKARGADPNQIVGRMTPTTALMVAMNCPADWEPDFATGWSGSVITRMGTNDCVQVVSATKAPETTPTTGTGGGGGGSTITTPNLFSVVQSVAANEGAGLLGVGATTAERLDNAGRFTELVAQALYRVETGWGLLRKTSGALYNNHAVDQVYYRSSLHVVTIVTAPDTTGATIAWLDQGVQSDDSLWINPFAPTTGVVADFYVDAFLGSDSALGTIGAPFQTIPRALYGASPGQTILVRAGIYVDPIDHQHGTYTVPSGTPAARITVAAYPSETVIIRAPRNRAGIQLSGTAPPAYLNFEDLIVDNVNCVAGDDAACIYISDGSHHIRFTRVEAKNAKFVAGVQGGDTADGLEFFDCNVHDIGYPGDSPSNGHAYYMSGSDCLFEGGETYNCTGYGYHIYENAGAYTRPSRNIVRKATIHDIGQHGTPAFAILFSWGLDNLAYDNVIYDCPGGLTAYTRSRGTKLYHNTITRCGEAIALQYYDPTSPPLVRNNIDWANTSGINDYGPYTGAAPNGVIDHNFQTDPLFTNAGANDFTLQAGSGAKDYGVTLADVPDDKNGVARPVGAAPSAGAYES